MCPSRKDYLWKLFYAFYSGIYISWISEQISLVLARITGSLQEACTNYGQFQHSACI